MVQLSLVAIIRCCHGHHALQMVMEPMDYPQIHSLPERIMELKTELTIGFYLQVFQIFPLERRGYIPSDLWETLVYK